MVILKYQNGLVIFLIFIYIKIIGHEYGINSDGFFELEELPKKGYCLLYFIRVYFLKNLVLIVGAGYIAVEIAGILNALGNLNIYIIFIYLFFRK